MIGFFLGKMVTFCKKINNHLEVQKRKMNKNYYREKIIELVEKIENPATLKFILLVIESYLKSRGI